MSLADELRPLLKRDLDDWGYSGPKKDALRHFDNRIAPLLDELERARKGHCKDCCCARIWRVMGIEEYTGLSIDEEVQNRCNELKRARKALEAAIECRDQCPACAVILEDLRSPDGHKKWCAMAQYFSAARGKGEA